MYGSDLVECISLMLFYSSNIVCEERLSMEVRFVMEVNKGNRQGVKTLMAGYRSRSELLPRTVAYACE